jgi:hypothetical protein
MAQPAMAVQSDQQSSKTAESKDLSSLSAQEQKVIAYLQNDWGKDFSVTSVDLAMKAVGLRPSDDKARFRLGNYIKQNPELHEVVRRWGWETLVLTPNEKLIARAIINAARDQQKTPSLAEVAKAVGVSKGDAKRGLQMLERYGILKQDKSVGGVKYAVAAPRYLKWEPRLDFLFHQVTLSSGRQLNTN